MAPSLPLYRLLRLRGCPYFFTQLRYLNEATANAVVQSQKQDDVYYPPVKPKYPPGLWGKMDRKTAWRWHDKMQEMLQIPDLEGRLKALTVTETPAMILEALNEHPASLEFRQYVTNTIMMPWKQAPQKMFNEMDTEITDLVVTHLKKSISEHFRMEHNLIRKNNTDHFDSVKVSRCKSLIQCINETIITHLGQHCDHLRTCQYDEDVLVRALWHRHGFERNQKRETQDPDLELYDTMHDYLITSEGIFDAMLRSHLPLPEFEAMKEGSGNRGNLTSLKFKPLAYGQKVVEQTQPKTVLAGHKLGDPCEFGLVGFVSTCSTQDLDQTLGTRIGSELRLALGLTNSFTWLAGQACNQGFSHLVEMRYPLTSQTILTDGHKFTFMAYQLNTLELWKDEEGQPLVNLCWHTEEMPLYDSIEHGEVKELNEDVLRQLVRTFSLAPVDRGYDMKPSITEKPEDVTWKKDFVKKRVVVEVVEEEEEYIVGQ